MKPIIHTSMRWIQQNLRYLDWLQRQEKNLPAEARSADARKTTESGKNIVTTRYLTGNGNSA